MTEVVEWCTVVWQVVDGASSGSTSAWTTFGVSALTGSIGVLGILIGQKNQARSQAKSVRAALLAEVAAISRQLVTQNAERYLRAAAAEIRKNTDPRTTVVRRARFVTQGDVNKIFKANLAHLGGLSKREAVLIVRFHYLLEGAFAAMVDGGPLAEGRSEPSMFENVANSLKEVLELAEELARDSRTWFGFRRRGQNVDT